MRTSSSLMIGCALLAAVSAQASGQPRTNVASAIGVLYRYSGDTIWNERDTTVRRTIYRGDTLVQTTHVNGRLMNGRTVVIVGDSAYTISMMDSLGQSHPARAFTMPARMANNDREAIAREIQSSASRARMMSSPFARPSPTDVPIAPKEPLSYCVDGSLSIRQHVDTVQYIRAVPGKADTVTYLFIGDTTVKRLSPSPREFGYAMANTIIGDIHMSLVRKSIDARTAPVAAGLPGRSSTSAPGCAGR